MEEKKKEKKSEGLYDPDRAAYMIAWRDRHIEKQSRLIEGYEESMALMEALLAFALLQRTSEEGGARVVQIPKKEIREVLSGYASEVESDEEKFTVRFIPRVEPQDGGEQSAP